MTPPARELPPVPPPSPCRFCPVCGECLHCEPECWCRVKARLHEEATREPSPTLMRAT
jgi:hypothetical protein